MGVPFAWVSIGLGGCVALTILYMVRKNHLVVSHSLWWLFVAAGSIVLGFFPKLMDWIAIRIGVHYPPIFVVALVIAMMIIKMLSMDLDLSEKERKIRQMAQRIAILEHEIRSQKDRCEK
jgi:hypothetical protein